MNRSRSRGRARSLSRARSQSRGRSLPRTPSRGRSRSRSRPPMNRSRSRSRSNVRGSRSLTPGGRGRQRQTPRLVLFRSAGGSSSTASTSARPALTRSSGGLRRAMRGARFPNARSRGRFASSSRLIAGVNEWKMAGTFRSDYIQRQRNYHTLNNGGPNDIYLTSDEVGGNQLLVNIQNEYAMQPAPGSWKTWQRSRGLHRNQILGIIGHRKSQIDMGGSGDATFAAPSVPNSARLTVALRGSSRNSTNYSLPRKMTESPAQLVPTLVVEQNMVENMGQPSANTTRMTLSERFSKQIPSRNETETVFIQGEN